MQARAFAAGGLRQAPGRCAQQPRHSSRSLCVKVSANMCPYNTLGVQANASDNEIKQAYRKLVLQYHPDVNHGQGVVQKFMTIQQAYELLTGKSRNGRAGAGGGRTDWAFHDWYWSFMQKRRWGSYKRGSAAAAAAAADAATSSFSESTAVPPHKQPEHQATLRTQLAGLRHRAAIRAKKQQNRAAASASAASSATSTMEDEEAQGSPLEYDSTETSDGCNMASGVTDWQAAEAAHAATSARRRFSATESHRQQVMERLAGLHRMAAEKGAGGMW